MSKRQIKGPLSVAVNKAIGEHAGRYSDHEIAEALNATDLFKEQGITIDHNKVRVRRVQTLGIPRAKESDEERPSLVITLDVNDTHVDAYDGHWSPEHVNIVKAKFAEARKFPRRSEKLKEIWQEMVAELTKKGKSNITSNMISSVARDHKLGTWGMEPKELERRDRKVIEALLLRAGNYRSKEALLAALQKKTPLDRFTSLDGLSRRVAKLGLTLPEFAEEADVDETPLSKNLKVWMTETAIALLAEKKPPEDIVSLQKAVRARLPELFAGRKDEVTKQAVLEVLYKHYFKWEDREKLLQAAVKAGVDVDRLYANLMSLRTRIPPRWLLEARLNEMHGRTHAPRMRMKKALPGILRVPFLDEHGADASETRSDLPETTYEQPYHALADSKEEIFNIGVISAPKIGLPYHVDIWSNLLRCGLSTAKKQKCDALVIGGGLFEISLRKVAGHNRLLTDMVLAGKDFDPESVAECYQAEAREIIESGSFDPIYVTAAERFAELLRGWFKLGHMPGGKPEFPGPIFVVLSPDDIEIIRKITDAEQSYQQKTGHARAEAQLRYHMSRRVAAEKELDKAHESDDRRGISLIEADLAEIDEDLDRAEDLVHRSYKSNFSPTQSAELLKRAMRYFIAKVEASIPNATVVDLNTAFMRFGKSAHVFKFSCPIEQESFKREVSSFGPSQRAGKLADMIVLMHSSALYYRMTTRQNYKDGKMVGESLFVDAPTLIDRDAILERTRGSRVPIASVKAVSDPMYNGGMLLATTHPDHGVGCKLLTANMVQDVGRARKVRKPPKMLWIMEDTDWHIGGAMRYRIYRPDDTVVGVTEATLEMLQRSGIDDSGAAHVGMYIVADDMLNGNHFGTERSPHYHEQSIARIFQQVHKLQKEAEDIRNSNQLREHNRQVVQLLAGQLALRVPHTLTTQTFELVDGVVNPYADVFKAILLRAKKSRVEVRGISEYIGCPDRRDVGVINFGSGNHAGKTAEYMWHEGPNNAEFLRQRFMNDPDLSDMDLKRLIAAPVSQRESFGYGTVCVDGKFTYGLHIAATPPKRTSWYDLVEGWVKVNRQRGNPSTILNDMPILHITGDKHFFSVSYAGSDLYVMGPAATHTDEFAEMAGGLPENNTGVAFIGIPIDGPDSGPIDVVHLTPSEIQEYISHPGREVPWGDICPNPA